MTATITDISKHFSKIVNDSKNPFVVTDREHPVAIIIPIKSDDDAFALALKHSPELVQLMEDCREDMERGDYVNARDVFD